MLHVYQLTHKTMGLNGGGQPEIIGVVGRDGRAWSIGEAADLMKTRQAEFWYRGKKLYDLMLLPSQESGQAA
jgi:hypothetical protein